MEKKFELVQVHEIGNEAEIIIRDKNSFLAYGGNLKKVDNPRAYYPPKSHKLKPIMDYPWYKKLLPDYRKKKEIITRLLNQ